MIDGLVFEKQLAELFLSQREEDLREFVVLAGPMVFTFLNRIGVSRSERDDLYQEVFMRVIKAKHQFDPTRKITAWLFTITVNLTRSRFRMKKESYSIDDIREPVSSNPSSLEKFVGKELIGRIEKVIVFLPLAQREAILLCGFEQIDQKEAASILKIPEGTLRTNLRRARIKLSELLNESPGLTLERAVV